MPKLSISSNICTYFLVFNLVLGCYGIPSNSDVQHLLPQSLDDLTGQWTELEPEISAPGRMHFGIVYDSTQEKILLYGGNRENSLGDDTWQFDTSTNTWNQRNVSNSPPPLNYHAMAYDSKSEKTILFGGVPTSSLPINETWVYDYVSNNWTQIFTETAPSPRRDHRMVYDPIDDKTILFGGIALAPGGGLVNVADTWAFDYSSLTWTKLTPDVSPSARHTSAITYDSIRQQIVLYGGNTGYHSGYIDEMWIFDYTEKNWTLQVPTNSPEPLRADFNMVHDLSTDKFIFFGGFNTEGRWDDTWIYDYTENRWMKLDTDRAPDPRYTDGIIYDPVSQNILLYSGDGEHGRFGDTWSLDLNLPMTSSSTSRTITTSSQTSTSTTYFPIWVLLSCIILIPYWRRRKQS